MSVALLRQIFHSLTCFLYKFYSSFFSFFFFFTRLILIHTILICSLFSFFLAFFLTSSFLATILNYSYLGHPFSASHCPPFPLDIPTFLYNLFLCFFCFCILFHHCLSVYLCLAGYELGVITLHQPNNKAHTSLPVKSYRKVQLDPETPSFDFIVFNILLAFFFFFFLNLTVC